MIGSNERSRSDWRRTEESAAPADERGALSAGAIGGSAAAGVGVAAASESVGAGTGEAGRTNLGESFQECRNRHDDCKFVQDDGRIERSR